MAVERTLSIIKPDAVAKNVIGKIYSRFETNGLKIIAARMLQLSRAEAEGFYAVHNGRPFFKDLVKFMISGPVMVQVLEGESAIAKNRELMGATDPKKADKGTIRADFADSIDANAVHGSDGAGNGGKVEIAYFFPTPEHLFALNRDARESEPARSSTPTQLAGFFAEIGEKPFRAKQLMRWMHQFGEADFSKHERPGQSRCARSSPRARSMRGAADSCRTAPLPTARANG